MILEKQCAYVKWLMILIQVVKPVIVHDFGVPSAISVTWEFQVVKHVSACDLGVSCTTRCGDGSDLGDCVGDHFDSSKVIAFDFHSLA